MGRQYTVYIYFFFINDPDEISRYIFQLQNFIILFCKTFSSDPLHFLKRVYIALTQVQNIATRAGSSHQVILSRKLLAVSFLFYSEKKKKSWGKHSRKILFAGKKVLSMLKILYKQLFVQ
jgi:hypothetical protein